MERRDLVVIGGGPGGYTAAIRAAQLGLRVALVERDRLGGVCGNWGCIPSKALLASATIYDRAKHGSRRGIRGDSIELDYAQVIAQSRAAAERVSRGVAGLLRRSGVEVIEGEARLEPGPRVAVEGRGAIEAERVLLATGSIEKRLPGLEPDPPRVVTSRELLAARSLPRRIAIVGGGAIGCEFGYALSAFGAEVCLLEAEPQLLPGLDSEIVAVLERSLRRRGVDVRTGTPLLALERHGEALLLRVAGARGDERVGADVCLVAVGRVPNLDSAGIREAGVRVDERGFVAVDESFRTSARGVLAIGDLVDSPQLAHVASAEAVRAVEIAAGRRAPGRLDPLRIPACVYCHPEVATIGLAEREARERGYDVSIGTFPAAALGRAVAEAETEGLVKIVSERRHGEILGCHVVGAGATETIAEAAAAMGLEATLAALGQIVHPHPGFAEGFKGAALAALGEAIDA